MKFRRRRKFVQVLFIDCIPILKLRSLLFSTLYSVQGEVGLVPPSYDDVVNGSEGEDEEIAVDEQIIQIRKEEEIEAASHRTQHQVFHFKSEVYVDGGSISSVDHYTNHDSGSSKSSSSDAMVVPNNHRILDVGEGDDLSLDATVNVTSSDGGGLGDEVL